MNEHEDALMTWAKETSRIADERIAAAQKQIAEREAQDAPVKRAKTKRRRARGEGSVYKREDGTWYYKFKWDGVWYRGSCGDRTSKTYALDFLDQKRREARNGTFRPKSVTLSDLKDAVIANVRANGRKYEARVVQCFAHLERILGKETPASKIEPLIDNYIATRLSETVGDVVEGEEPRTTARATVNRELAALRRGFKLRRRSIAVTPEIRLLAENNVRTRFPSEDEIEVVVARLPEGLAGAVRLLSVVPWRVSEALDLLWRQVDEKTGEIRQEAAEYKSGREARVLPYAVFPALRDLIAERHRLTDEWDREHSTLTPWVFWYEGKGEHGQPAALPYAEYAKTWDRACENAKVADFHVHDLKRYAARAMVRAGVDEETIMKLAGWRSRSMLQRYSIRNNDDLVDGMRKLAHATQDRTTDARTREA